MKKPHYIIRFILLRLMCSMVCGLSQESSHVVQLSVPLNRPWTETKVAVTSGHTLTIIANGTMNWFTGGAQNRCLSTPDGQAAPNAIVQQRLVVPSFPAYSLIGKIGRQGRPFAVGSAFSATVSEGGTLFLGVNDEGPAFGDNTGTWIASISERPLPQVGDAILFWNDRVIMHSGRVTSVDHGRVMTFTSYVIDAKDLVPDVSPEGFGGYVNWTVYHTDRAKEIQVKRVAGDTRAGVTSANNLVRLLYGTPNCHGYTFIPYKEWHENLWGINGYYSKGVKGRYREEHINQTNVDQAFAAQLILRDNGFLQIPANGPEVRRVQSHYQFQYEVGLFADEF